MSVVDFFLGIGLDTIESCVFLGLTAGSCTSANVAFFAILLFSLN
jgi:high-affinity nickel permease